jgi:hypothetical protein
MTSDVSNTAPENFYLRTAELDASVPIIGKGQIVIPIDGTPSETLPFVAAIFWSCRNF